MAQGALIGQDNFAHVGSDEMVLPAIKIFILNFFPIFLCPAGRWEFWRQGSEARVHQESVRNTHVPGKKDFFQIIQTIHF